MHVIPTLSCLFLSMCILLGCGTKPKQLVVVRPPVAASRQEEKAKVDSEIRHSPMASGTFAPDPGFDPKLGNANANPVVVHTPKSDTVDTDPSFRWPRPIISDKRSHGGKMMAIYDSTGFYLADRLGRHRRKLRIRVEWNPEDTEAEFSFNKGDTLLATMVGGWYGEPHVNCYNQLWCVDTRSGKAWNVAKYEDSLLGTNRVIEVGQRLGPWLDARSIKITAEVWKVVEGVAEAYRMGERTFKVRMARMYD